MKDEKTVHEEQETLALLESSMNRPSNAMTAASPYSPLVRNLDVSV